MGIEITERDLQLFGHLVKARFITLDQAAVLFFRPPGTSYSAFPSFRNTARVRLNKLKEAGYIDAARFGGDESKGSGTNYYYLTFSGLGALGGLIAKTKSPPKIPKGSAFARHYCDVNECFIDINLATETSTAQDLLDWSTEKAYDVDGQGRNYQLRPDGYGIFQQSPDCQVEFWLELDRGSMTAKPLSQKFERYFESVIKNHVWKKFGFSKCPVTLFVTPERNLRKVLTLYEGLVGEMDNEAAWAVYLSHWRFSSPERISLGFYTEGEFSDAILGPAWYRPFHGEELFDPFSPIVCPPRGDFVQVLRGGQWAA